MEIEVRRSDRIKQDNADFKRSSCSNTKCLPCNTAPLIAQKTVAKNLTTTFCKVDDQTLEAKLAKKPKRRSGEEMTNMNLAKGEADTSKSSK